MSNPPGYEMYGLLDEYELAASLLFRIIRSHETRHGKRPTEITLSRHLREKLTAEGHRPSTFAGIKLLVTDKKLRVQDPQFGDFFDPDSA